MGHASMHLTHAPHVFLLGASGSKSRSVIIWPRNIHEPWLPVRMFGVSYRNQPNPALAAAARSSIGPSSTYQRAATVVPSCLDRPST